MKPVSKLVRTSEAATINNIAFDKLIQSEKLDIVQPKWTGFHLEVRA